MLALAVVLHWALVGLVAMGALLAAAVGTGSALALVLVIAAVVGLTLGEVAGGAAVWRVALDRVPDGAEGRYQAAYSMSSSAARIVGPLVALPLVIAAPRAGWLVLALVMGSAAVAVAAFARPRPDRSAPVSAGVGVGGCTEGGAPQTI